MTSWSLWMLFRIPRNWRPHNVHGTCKVTRSLRPCPLGLGALKASRVRRRHAASFASACAPPAAFPNTP
eukprot:1047001-Rhodomonas_salina.1